MLDFETVPPKKKTSGLLTSDIYWRRIALRNRKVYKKGGKQLKISAQNGLATRHRSSARDIIEGYL